MFKNEYEEESVLRSTQARVLESSGLNFQNLYGEETIPEGSSHGRFDASLEEILHLITDYGYGQVYKN